MDKIQEIQEALFSPLSKKHCLYFYAIMVVVFASLVFNIVSLLLVAVRMKRTMKDYKRLMGHTLMTVLPGLVLYYQSRLMYSICVN